MTDEWIFWTRLTIHECFEQLKRSSRGGPSDLKIECTLMANGFRLNVIRGYRNPYAPVFWGKFEEFKEGTRVRGNFSIRELPLGFFIGAILAISVILGITFTYILLIIVMHGLLNPKVDTEPLAGAFLGVGMLIGMAALVFFIVYKGLQLGRPEEVRMLDFIKAALHTEKDEAPNVNVSEKEK